MFCANCGRSLPDGSKFCIHCGLSLVQDSPTPASYSNAEQPNAPQQWAYANPQTPPSQNSFGQSAAYPNSQYQNPQYQNPQYQNPQYQNPQYQSPQYQNPQYQNPQYQNPQYQNPQYQNPQYQSPQYQTPQYQSPQYQDSLVGAAARGAVNAAQAGHRAVSRGRRTAILALLLFAVLAILSLLYTVFLKKGTPEQTIEKMEDALNNLDQEALLECFDDQLNSLYSGAMGVGESLTDLPLGDLADLGSGLGSVMAAAGLTPHFEIEILEITYSDDKESCVVYVDMSYSYMGESDSEEVSLPMILDGREWLISMNGLESLEGLLY